MALFLLSNPTATVSGAAHILDGVWSAQYSVITYTKGLAENVSAGCIQRLSDFVIIIGAILKLV